MKNNSFKFLILIASFVVLGFIQESYGQQAYEGDKVAPNSEGLVEGRSREIEDPSKACDCAEDFPGGLYTDDNRADRVATVLRENVSDDKGDGETRKTGD